jgi:hypothetical protein
VARRVQRWGRRVDEGRTGTFQQILCNLAATPERRIREIGVTIAEILIRIGPNDEQITQRIESPAYRHTLDNGWLRALVEKRRVERQRREELRVADKYF